MIVGAGIQTQILCKISKFFEPLRHLVSPVGVFPVLRKWGLEDQEFKAILLCCKELKASLGCTRTCLPKTNRKSAVSMLVFRNPEPILCL